MAIWGSPGEGVGRGWRRGRSSDRLALTSRLKVSAGKTRATTIMECSPLVSSITSGEVCWETTLHNMSVGPRGGGG